MMPLAPDGTIDVGEATLATLGLTNIVKGDIPYVGVGVQRDIIGIGKRIDGLATDFVYDRLPKKLSMPRPFTYRQLLDRFTKPISVAEETKLHAKFPRDATDTWLAFKSALTNAYDHLAEIVPVAAYDTYLGPKKILPTSDKTFEFFNKLWVIDNPLIAFQLMQQGAIIPEQVTALLDFFPSLYSHMKGAILNALVARNMRESTFVNLPPRADRGLATFKQQRIVPYAPNVPVAPSQAPAGPPAQPVTPKINESLQTKGQKAAELG